MAVVPMRKIHLVALQADKSEILKCLQAQEVLEIETFALAGANNQTPGDKEPYELQLAEIKSAIHFIEKIRPHKKGLIESFAPVKAEVTAEELFRTCRDFACRELIEEYKAIEVELANLKNLQNELRSDIEQLLPWQKLDLPLNQLSRSQKTGLLLGEVSRQDFKPMTAGLSALDPRLYFEVINQSKQKIFLAIIYLIDGEKKLLDFLSGTSFIAVNLPVSERDPAAEIAQLKHLLGNAAKAEAEYQAEAAKLAEHQNKLKFMHDNILENKNLIELGEKLGYTNYTFIVEAG